MTVATRQIAATGIAGLDIVLTGGLTKDRTYLVQGDPGVGKTTLGLHFMREGVSKGESCLYLTLSETKEELEGVAASHGWTLDGIHLFEYSAHDRLETQDESTLFHPSEVELGEAMKALLVEVDRVKPTRVVIDSLSEIRLLAQNPLRYRRQVLGLKHYFSGRKCTVLLLDDRQMAQGDMQLMTLAHGVITLEQLAPLYGAERRRLRVSKLRGVRYRGGYHDFNIRTGGLVVYPRLVASEHKEIFKPQQIASGVPSLDQLLGGGIDRGTSTLIIGPAGAGKSGLAAQYVYAAAKRGENAAVFIFDESRGTLFARTSALSIDLAGVVDQGRVTVQQIDPAEIPPGEFVHLVREAVEERNAKIVVIDSLNGYMNAMPEEQFLTVQMHELLMYLGQKGVATILVVAQHGLIGSSMQSPVDVSYLADCVMLLRYYEHEAEIRKAVSVLKKRSGEHEKAIRPLNFAADGVSVGPPLAEFHGILSGAPMVASNGFSGFGGSEERGSEARLHSK